ncbi:MAG: colanic acid/amylovoran biosynthesis glycosyltransferase [Hyphomicrobiaceae bacterium]|jgi:glycosyltransferase involved in cell wall biosynthesis
MVVHAEVRVAYLVNQYPKTSHSFIRREIDALESEGVAVERFSIRTVAEPLVDPADQEERGRTTVILDCGWLPLAMAVLATCLSSPLRFLRASKIVAAMARRSDRGLLRVFAWLCEACWLRRRVRQSGAQHLHAHFGTNSASVAMFVEILGGPSWSFTAHGTETFEDPQAVSIALKLQKASFAIAISEWGRAQLLEWTPHDRHDRVHVVRCGVDDSFLSEPASPVPSTARLACISRISPEKGIDVLCDAIVILHREGRDFQVALVGDGDGRDRIAQTLEQEGAAHHLLMLGWGDGEVVRRELHAARALVLPSRGEGLPVVLMEAMALQRPAVATAVGAVSELVQDSVTGWLVPPGDAEALAAGMRAALVASPKELEAMGQHGRRLIEERHDVRREARRLKSLFAGNTTHVPPATSSQQR